MKRLFDISHSFIGLIIASPLLIVIAVLIKVFSPGPLLFCQNRIGLKNSIFKLYKFRTMKVAKEKEKGSFDIGDISRITPLGRILRKTKIDELPQLINVLKGDMSLVGPRPEVKKWTEVYPEKWDIVLSVKPGITDNASIEFRNEEEILSTAEDPEAMYRDVVLPRKLDLYIDYVNNHSFRGDLKIIFKTIVTVITK